MTTLSSYAPSAAHPAPGAQRALYEAVADALRQRILDRELAPGCWIDELKLAQEFGTSRTPMREALKVLAAEGLVTMKVRRGAYVTEVREDEVREIYHLLAVLESDAAADVALQASAAELAELQVLHEQLTLVARDHQAAPGDHALIDAFFAVNQQFHQRLLEMGRNRWRLQIVQDLRKVMMLGRHHSLFKQGRIAQSLDEHTAILQALLDRDIAATRQAVEQHFAQGLQAAG